MARFRFVTWFLEWLWHQEKLNFEWDKGNTTKSFLKHAVTVEEAEELFADPHLVVLGQQVSPVVAEERFSA